MSSPQTRKRTQRLQSHGETITVTAKRQIVEVGHIAQDGISSGAWAYPILGIYHLLTHPSLMKPLLPTLFKGILLSAGVVIALFAFAYLPQVAVLAFVSGPLAFVLAVPLILGEAYAIVLFLTKALLVGPAGTDLFDAILLQKGYTTLVENGRQVTSKSGATKVLGALVMKPLSRFSTDNIVRYLLTLPLNLIPVVGTGFFLAYNGLKAGPAYHARYFQLKGFDKERRQAFIKQKRGAYTVFGTVAMVLNLVPVVSVLFNFTTSAGAALWAADLEGKSKAPSGPITRQAAQRSQAQEVEVLLPDASRPYPQQLQSLYSATLNAASRFATYNFNRYFVRRTNEIFKPVMASVAPAAGSAPVEAYDPAKLAKFYATQQAELEVLQRAAEINRMYEGPKLVVEHAKPITSGGGAGMEASTGSGGRPV